MKIYTKLLFNGGSHRLLRILSRHIKNSIRMFTKRKSVELYSFETIRAIKSRWTDLWSDAPPSFCFTWWLFFNWSFAISSSSLIYVHFFLKKQDNQKYCQRRAVDFISVRIENVFCERTDENILVITVFLYSSFMVYLCLPGKFRSQHKGYVDASMIQVCFIVAAGKYSSVY